MNTTLTTKSKPMVKKPAAAKAAKKDRPSALKQALPGAKRGPSTFYMDPDDLVLVEDKNHHLYDPRVHWPVNNRLKKRIRAAGRNLVAVLVVREGDKVLVGKGRQRVKAMRALKQELLAEGLEPILVRCEVERGRPIALFEGMVDENECRTQDDPISRAEKILAYVNMGKSYEDVVESQLFFSGDVTVAWVKKYVTLLDLCPEVQQAVSSGGMTVTRALGLVGKSVAEQLAALKAPAPKTGPKAPSKKKITLAIEESRVPVQIRLAIQWARGLISDEEVARLVPSLRDVITPKEE